MARVSAANLQNSLVQVALKLQEVPHELAGLSEAFNRCYAAVNDLVASPTLLRIGLLPRQPHAAGRKSSALGLRQPRRHFGRDPAEPLPAQLASTRRDRLITLTFNRRDVEGIATAAPVVAAAMKKHGINVQVRIAAGL